MGILNLVNISLCFFLLNSCQSPSDGQQKNNDSAVTTSTINLENRESFSLPPELDEISGHIFLPNNDNIVYCVQDELGTLYGFDLSNQQVVSTKKFADKGDFEGVTTDGKNFYVLKSNGNIYSFSVDEAEIVEPKIAKVGLGKGEYESLAIDTVKKQLIVLCKSCKEDKGNKQSTGYLLNYTDNGDVTLDKPFIINLEEASAISSSFPRVFNPSAITKKVSTNEWYILSSIDKLILITDADFKPKEVIPFSRKLYEQPEGLAFDSKEKLYISSEKGDNASAMIYKIK